MSSKVLGRGLDALFCEINAVYENESSNQDNLIDINLNEINSNPFQPRKFFNKKSLQELSNSIIRDGLIQPIILSKSMDGYIIVAGERRYRAAKLAKLKTIRSIVLSNDEYKLRQFSLIENIQRENLNSIELAFAYSELIKLHKITHNELSIMINKSRTHITNSIRLLKLSEKIQNSIIDNQITTGHAKVLIGLDENQQQIVVDLIIKEKLNVREIETIVKKMKEKNNDSYNEKTIKYDFLKIKKRFNTLGFNSKSLDNKLILEFNSEKQLDDFLSYFSK